MRHGPRWATKTPRQEESGDGARKCLVAGRLRALVSSWPTSDRRTIADAGRSMSLLQPDDPPPFEAVNPDGRAPLLLVCDHASAAVPRKLGGGEGGGLGVAAREMQTHI